MIKNLIFDFGKVLVNHDLQPLLERHFGDESVFTKFYQIRNL